MDFRDLVKATKLSVRTGLPYNFSNKAVPPPNTPDLCLLQDQEYHLVFDWDNRVKTPCAQPLAFSDQRFCMFLQNHENGTPGLVFNKQMINRQMIPGRLKGKVHPLTTKQLVELDCRVGNRVQSFRRRMRVILPDKFEEGRTKNSDVVTPAKVYTWMYYDNAYLWKEKFQFDWELWRNKKDGAYIPAPCVLDDREFVRWHFQPFQREAHKPKYLIPARLDLKRMRADAKVEERVYLEDLRENPPPEVKWPERNFIVMRDLEF